MAMAQPECGEVVSTRFRLKVVLTEVKRAVGILIVHGPFH